MQPLPTYTIRGTSGDEAEAEGIAAARACARRLVEDGNERADILRPERVAGWPVLVERAERDQHGRPIIRGTSLSRGLR